MYSSLTNKSTIY